jgi:zinc/manganese transport system ATP-binding protein
MAVLDARAAAEFDNAAVEFDNAAVTIAGRTIWSNVTLTVPAGEFVAVLGPNGVGKSTLIKVALGLLPLSAGSAHVLGRAPGGSRRDIGYLPQRRSFDAALHIRGVDMVQLGIDGERWGLPALTRPSRRRESSRRIRDVIELVGAEAYAQRPIGELSGGEQQRLLIAQALVQNPKVLLLDEPLDSLDLPTQGSVAALIGQVSREAGVTVIMVAHDVNPIISHLDRVIYLAGGGAVQGPPDEVITSETLTRLYDSPIEVLKTSDGRLVVVGQPDAAHAHGGHHSGHTDRP